VVTVGFVVDQSVPAAHNGACSFAHLSLLLLCLWFVSIGSNINVEGRLSPLGPFYSVR